MVNHRNSAWKVAVLFALIFVMIGSENSGYAKAAVQTSQKALQQNYVQKLTQIAAERRKIGRTTEAAAILKVAENVPSNGRTFRLLPRTIRTKIPETLPAKDRAWRVEIRKAQEKYADDLYELARRAVKNGDAIAAYRLIHEVAKHNSDHKYARRILGYSFFSNHWVTAFEKKQLLKGKVWHKKFGWLLKKEYVARYEKGDQRYYDQDTRRWRWVSAKNIAALRALRIAAKSPWEIQTEHFLVKTDHSLEQGVLVAKKLEQYHQLFFQVFASFFNSRAQIQKLFTAANVGPRKVTKPYVVYFYKDKKTYVTALQTAFPRMARQLPNTNGFYSHTARAAFFFHSAAGKNDYTMYHEATHQLFYESLTTRRNVAEKANFWITEGIACYMESFQTDGKTASLGDPTNARFHAAKFRCVKSKYYIPLNRFAGMGMRPFQGARQIAKNYSQASGLAKFFMDYDNGRYREALIQHLAQIYRARGNVQSLAALTKVHFSTLDKQYKKYISELKTTKE